MVYIFNIKQKAKYLAIALKIALDEILLVAWLDSCTKAIIVMDDYNAQLDDYDNGRSFKCDGTIQRWLRIFRSNSEYFPNPHYVWRGKALLPQLLDNYSTFRKSLMKE